MNEEWRPAPGFEAYYEVSSLGRIRRIARAKGTTPFRIVKPWPDGNGRLRVYLSKNNTQTVKVVARLVARAFLGESRLEVNHIDGDFTHNDITNLEYTTRKENAAHASRMGLMAHGTRIPWSKLTDQIVKEIRASYAEGYDYASLAARFNVHPGTIGYVVRGQTWRHVL